MKKTYIAPGLVVVKVNPTTVICTSSIEGISSPEYDGVAETSTFRSSNLWEDNWE